MNLRGLLPHLSRLSDPARWLAAALYALLYLLWLVWPALLLDQVLPIGLGLLFSTNLLFLVRSRRYLVLPDLLPLLGVLGMWVAPALQYWLEARHWNIGPDAMHLSAAAYFPIVLPGVLALGLGTQLGLLGFAGPDGERLERAVALCSHRKWVIGSAVIGLIGSWLAPVVPAWANLVAVFLQSFLWVALYQALFLPASRFKYVALGLLLLMVIVQALRGTMFGDLVFGLLIAGLYLQLRQGWGPVRLVLAQLVAVLLVGWLLSFKYEYRKTVQADSSNLALSRQFGLSATRSLRDSSLTVSINHILARVNQGNVSALAFDYVPRVQPYVRGETIRTALLGMLVPRLFWPDKPRAGGVDNIRRFMGIPHLHYSINIGTLGEAYVNYGPGAASTLYLFLYGWVLSALFDLCRRWSDRFPGLFFLLPLVFLPALTVETDLLIVSNHVFKAGVFVLGIILALRFKMWPM